MYYDDITPNTELSMLRLNAENMTYRENMTYHDLCHTLDIGMFEQTGWEDAVTPEITPVIDVDKRGLINGLVLTERNPDGFQEECIFLEKILKNGFVPSNQFLQRFAEDAAIYARAANESQALEEKLYLSDQKTQELEKKLRLSEQKSQSRLKEAERALRSGPEKQSSPGNRSVPGAEADSKRQQNPSLLGRLRAKKGEVYIKKTDLNRREPDQHKNALQQRTERSK